MRRCVPALLACAVALAVAGCGDDKSTVDVKQVRSVVTQFGESTNAHACDLLSPNALQDVYGGFKNPLPQAKANCIKRSRTFKGEPVHITNVNIIDANTVRVTTLSPDGKITYNIAVRRFGPAWRIDDITQTKTLQ